PGLEQLSDQCALVPTRRLQDDHTRSGLGQTANDLANAVAIIGDRERFGIGVQRYLERIFRHIDTDVHESVHGLLPTLQMRARGFGRRPTAPAAVRARTKRPTTILLGFGLGSSEGKTICGRPLARGLYIPRASPLPRRRLL